VRVVNQITNKPWISRGIL